MAKLPRAKFTRERILILAGLALILAYPWGVAAVGQPFLIGLGARILVMGLAAASLDLVVGFGGMVSFGHAAFFGVGGYVVGILAFHAHDGTDLLGVIPGSNQALVAWPAAIVLGGLAALAIGALSLRTTGVHFIMITLAFSQVVYYIMLGLEEYGGDDGLTIYNYSAFPLVDLGDKLTLYWVALAVLVAQIVFFARLNKSRFGLVLSAAKGSERRVRSSGLDVYRYRLTAYVISGMLASLAGVLSANLTSFVTPDRMDWVRSGELLFVITLGGMGTALAPLIGSALFVFLEEFLSKLTVYWHFWFGLFLIITVLIGTARLRKVIPFFRRGAR
jgi:branched-chain amino acid transport system permease protein